MIIFKDRVSGDELFTDATKYSMEHDCVYVVRAKQVTRRDDGNYDTGANASEEAPGDDDTEATVISGIDVVLDNRLVETAFAKKDYQTYIKGYMKKIKEKFDESDPELNKFLKGAASFVKSVLGEFKEYQFFLGESLSGEGMVILCKWDEETPVLYFFKHGLIEEKV